MINQRGIINSAAESGSMTVTVGDSNPLSAEARAETSNGIMIGVEIVNTTINVTTTTKTPEIIEIISTWMMCKLGPSLPLFKSSLLRLFSLRIMHSKIRNL